MKFLVDFDRRLLAIGLIAAELFSVVAAVEGLRELMPVVVLLNTILCIVLLIRLRAEWERARVKPGYCTTCRYDLRATPERCPECGTISH